MKPADEIQIVKPGVAVWQAYDAAVKTDLMSCAFETPGGLVLCDPIALQAAAMDELLGLDPAGRVAGILLTSANHQRDSEAIARRFDVGIWARSAVQGEVHATHWFEEGESPLGAKAIALEGFAIGETAYLNDGVLILGDAIINLPPFGFSVLPDKYCEDPKLARESLKKLLRLPAGMLVFAHGLPIVADASAKLATLLD
jgi:hypothetical protein